MKKLLFAAMIFLAAVFPAAAQTVIQFALPTPETHPRNQALSLWASAVAARSSGRLIVKLHHGVTDYPGGRIAAAVAEGAYDMAAPGWWHISRIAPAFGLSALPMFYGRSSETVNRFYDGDIGQALNDRLEQKLRVRVLGRRLNLGFGHIYTTGNPVKGFSDLQGLNIRVPGGGADLARYLVFGATPRRVPVRDLVEALRQKLVDGLLATHNFVSGASLWDVGIRHAFLDGQVFYQYTPIINRARWEALLDEERTWLAQSWETAVGDMRRIVAEYQMRSRDLAAKNGVTYVQPSEDQLKSMRSTLMEEQAAIMAALEIDPQLVARAQVILSASERKN